MTLQALRHKLLHLDSPDNTRLMAAVIYVVSDRVGPGPLDIVELPAIYPAVDILSAPCFLPGIVHMPMKFRQVVQPDLRAHHQVLGQIQISIDMPNDPSDIPLVVGTHRGGPYRVVIIVHTQDRKSTRLNSSHVAI